MRNRSDFLILGPKLRPQSPLFIKGGIVAIAFALLLALGALYTQHLHSPLLVLVTFMTCYFALKDILARQDYRGAYLAAAFVMVALLLQRCFA